MPKAMDEQEEIKSLSENKERKKKAYTKTIQQLKKLKPFDADELFHTQHDAVFSEIDCLHCGNCCKTTPPLLLNEDITRISKSLNIPVQKFMQKYVVKDEDGDLVFNKTPCPFLGSDNYCSIYSTRPNACREYPHTNRKKMHQIFDLTIANAFVCPAVARIFQNIEETLG
jgi:Fe-S-cluster containining protein